MIDVRVDVFRNIVLRGTALLIALALASRADAQGVFGPPPVNRLPSTGPSISSGPRQGSSPSSGTLPSPNAPPGTYTPVRPPESIDTPIDPLLEQKVVEIRVIGNDSRPTAQILSSITTRVDRPFDQALLEKDVRTLAQKKWFLDVRPIREQVPGGVRVTFEVIERPTLLYVKYLGNSKIKDKRLAKETDLKKGSSLDPYAVEEGRRKIEEYYQSKGYNDVRVVVLEGTKPGDRGAIFMINEGEAQKIKKTSFVGNTIASDQRLKTQIGSKPPILWVFKGQLSQRAIEEDQEKLIGYYRNLGFFRARVSREVKMDDKWKKADLQFVIDEGPRYKIRGVSFIGNRKFSNEQLGQGMLLKEGDYYLRRNLDQDITRLQDTYGSQGYVFANVQQELRFEEEPGELTVVFSVEEGSRYAVGKIHVHIAGENPHTRFNAVLNRLMFRPGDVVDTRKIRNAERRLKASSLFVNDPSKGQVPKITFTPPGEDEETSIADGSQGGGGRRVRQQSPDDSADEKKVDMHVFVDLNPAVAAAPDEQLENLSMAAQPPPQLKPTDWLAPRTSESNPVPRWWPVKSNPAAGNSLPRWWPGQTKREVPPLDIAADEVLIVRGQGPSEVVDQNRPPASGPARPANAAPTPSTPTTGVPVVVRPASSATETLSPMISSLNLSRPVSLNQSLRTARNTATPSVSLRPILLAPTTTAAQANQSATTIAGPSVTGPSATGPSGTGPASKPVASATPARSGSTPGEGWIVRGQNGYGGQMVQPLSPGPRTPPAYAAPSAAMYGGTAAFQSPASSMTPPQFSQPMAGMPQDPTATAEELPEELPQLPIIVNTEETQTGKFMFGVGVNSNAGLVGSIVVDEQNFDWRRPPTSIEDWRNGTAWRGAGQHFRIEFAPGTQFSRYLVSFNNPYLFDTNLNFGLSGYYFQRFYYDWYEQRLGGRVTFGYQFRPDLSGTVGFRAEDIIIKDPRVAIPDLLQVQGSNGLFSIQLGVVNDTRDNTFFPTEGRYINMQFEQATGSFTYPRVTLDMRKYFVLHQRPDGSGRQVLALYSYTGVSGANTPIYERFFIGGIGTMRGFYFRDASPTFDTVVVGGDFASYGTVEYTVPITADDMFRLAAFVDGGFDARTANVGGTDIRVAPGLGIRISVPAMGPAPIAVDFAIPVVMNQHDQKQLVNFAVGVAR